MTTERIAVLIIGDHPHAGEKGHIVEVDGKVRTISVAGQDQMVRVELEDCPHNEQACYAQGKDLRRL